MTAIRTINTIIALIFFVCYSYQFYYMAIAYFKGRRVGREYKLNNYAVLIAARNEETVISDLIASLNAQLYPRELITVFVVADNCTDGTAAAAREAGAVVFERTDTSRIGKGYALDFLLRNIASQYPEDTFDGYFVFDADNILEPDYIYEMNRTFSQGYNVVTGYRNSKNFGDNWISSGYSLWFLHESQQLNKARYILGESCNVSGTGFVFSNKLIKELGGWSYYLLTEDMEFTADNIIRGEKIGYCETAMLYDEQPVKLGQSARQRMRWAKGYWQVLSKHGYDLIKGVFASRNFSCYDMLMSIAPAFILSLAAIIVNLAGLLICVLGGSSAELTLMLISILKGFAGGYMTFFAIGAFTTLTEWSSIRCSTAKKLFYMLSFPVFMFTYLPISVAALFSKPEWKPIAHTKKWTQQG